MQQYVISLLSNVVDTCSIALKPFKLNHRVSTINHDNDWYATSCIPCDWISELLIAYDCGTAGLLQVACGTVGLLTACDCTCGGTAGLLVLAAVSSVLHHNIYIILCMQMQ